MPIAERTDLTERIQQLMQERRRLVDAVTHIDQAIDQIENLLQGLGRLPTAAYDRTPIGVPPTTNGRKGRTGRFATSGSQLILSFVNGKGSATTREISEYWKSQGRNGRPFNLLGQLVRSRKLDRRQLKDQFGSEYSTGKATEATSRRTNRAGRSAKKTGRYPMSAEASVVEFLTKHSNATTGEIKSFWESSGRKGRPDNALSLLVKAKKLKRTPIEGKLGSTYSLA